MVPPVALRFALKPVQIIASGDVVTTGNGLILITTLSFARQPLESISATWYSVVALGVATGFEIIEELKPDEGDHTYETPPPATSCVFCPIQIAVSGEMVGVGNANKLTVLVAVFWQPFESVTVTV